MSNHTHEKGPSDDAETQKQHPHESTSGKKQGANETGNQQQAEQDKDNIKNGESA